MLDHAIAYARKGWKVFRLTGYKTPFKGSHGFKDATVDEDVIRKWFGSSASSAYRRINIGLATGPIVVIDCDGPAALEEFKALCGGVIPRTLAARTSNGFHFYFNAPSAEGGQVLLLKSMNAPRKAKGDPGIDVKADKAYVVVAPSVNARTGFVYQWLNWGTEIAELPESVLGWHLARRGARPPQADKKAGPTVESLIESGSPGTERQGAKSGLAGRALTALRAGERDGFLEALRCIPTEGGYDQWFTIGAAIYDFDPGPGGLEILKSRSAPEFHAMCEAKWLEYAKPYEGKRITVATVYALAKDNAGTGPEAITPEVLASSAPSAMNEEPPHVNGHHSVGQMVVFKPVVARLDAIHWPDVNEHGEPRATTTNAGLAIDGLRVECRKDVFHEKMLVDGHLIDQWAGELSDDVVLMLRKAIKHQYGFDPQEKNTRDAAVQRCLQNQFNPVLQYLEGLPWDGTPRIGTWIADYLGAEPSSAEGGQALNNEFGRLMLLAAVRRVRKPGTKFDQIVVWEGKEGTNKSTALKILAGEDNFSDQNILAASDREQQEAVCGVWLYEIAELAGMRRADIERVKQFASRTEDRARPAYGRLRLDRKRQCVFVGTTNKETYLQSETGNRRFWPIKTGEIDVDRLARDRDQLWAEAVEIEKRGGSLELKRELWADAGEAQEGRREDDAWSDDIRPYLDKPEIEETSIRDVLLCGVRMDASQINQGAQNRAARVLRDLGWERFQKRIGESRVWRYKRPKSR